MLNKSASKTWQLNLHCLPEGSFLIEPITLRGMGTRLEDVLSSRQFKMQMASKHVSLREEFSLSSSEPGCMFLPTAKLALMTHH